LRLTGKLPAAFDSRNFSMRISGVAETI